MADAEEIVATEQDEKEDVVEEQAAGNQGEEKEPAPTAQGAAPRPGKGPAGKQQESTAKKAVLLGDVKVSKDVVPEGFRAQWEGSAAILLSTTKGADAFYNEVQVKNRDLSVLVLNEYARQLKRESEDQVDAYLSGKSHAKTPRTWQTWGHAARENSKADDGKAEAKEGDKEPKNRKLRQPHLKDSFHGMRILEGLAASGLRSLRYLREVTEGVGLDVMVCNDLEHYAVESMKQNAIFNGLDSDARFLPQQGDATQIMFEHRYNNEDKPYSMKNRTFAKALLKGAECKFNPKSDPFDVIDLDPYGSPVAFVDTAVQSVREGGLLCVTATDMPTLCGKSAEQCFFKYRAMPLHGLNKYSHEMAIRIVLGLIEARANQHNRHIVPILSVHMDFYIRVFVRVYTDPLEIMGAAGKLGLVLQSRGCGAFWIQPMGEHKLGTDGEAHKSNLMRPAALKVPTECTETGENLALGGPIWTGPIHNKAFVSSLLDSMDVKGENGFDPSRLEAFSMIRGVLLAVNEELVDVPLFYHLPFLCKVIHCQVPSLRLFASALLNAGYKYSASHYEPNGVKTDAPPHVMFDILREWTKQNPVHKDRLNDSKVARILGKEITTKVDFTIHRQVRQKEIAAARAGKSGSRYLPNPKKHWGPKAAAPGFEGRQTHKRSIKQEGADGKRPHSTASSPRFANKVWSKNAAPTAPQPAAPVATDAPPAKKSRLNDLFNL